MANLSRNFLHRSAKLLIVEVCHKVFRSDNARAVGVVNDVEMIEYANKHLEKFKLCLHRVNSADQRKIV